MNYNKETRSLIVGGVQKSAKFQGLVQGLGLGSRAEV